MSEVINSNQSARECSFVSLDLCDSNNKMHLSLLVNTATLVVVFINLLLATPMRAAYIFGIMLHNPIPDDLGLNDKNTTTLEVMSADRPQAVHQGRCQQDSDCINDNGPESEPLMYCDQHYGRCDYFHQVDQLCRYDSQCDSGLHCMFGRCARPFEPGHKGARCNETLDCNAGLCCARQHGEKICKPKLTMGQTCFVPSGGLEYSLNELCPCDAGLECQPVKIKSKRKRHFKTDTLMKCSQVGLNESSK